MASDPQGRPKPQDEQADWVMSFVDHSAEDRKPLDDIWDEVEQNVLVRPPQDSGLASNTKHPLAFVRSDLVGGRGRGGYAILKDPETHQQVWTICSKIVLALFPREGFVKARGRGFEDIFKATTVTELMQYAHRLPGHFWEFVQWVFRACTYGTGVIEAAWDFVEAPRPFRSLDYDPLTGAEVSSSTILIVPVYDDVRYTARDHRDFYPDPGADTMERMRGAALHDRIDARRAKTLARGGIYDRGATARALNYTKGHLRQNDEKSMDETAGTHTKESHPDFLECDRFRYIGEVPWREDDGIQIRDIHVVGGETVRSAPWPRRLPWFDLRILPRPGGSFWGMSPGEIVRYDQDFVDTLKMMLADAVVRMCHPSPIVADGAIINKEQFRTQRPDRPIIVEGDPNSAVAWPNFNPPISPAFEMWGGTKQQMREATGALGAIQGLGLGTKRFSASESVATFEQAYDRPELFARVVEMDTLPQLASYSLELYQEFLETTEDLRMRVGTASAGAVLADILPRFDIEYVGSRQMSDQQELAFFREIVTLGSGNEIAAQVIPWIPLLQRFFRRGGADEIAAMVGNPQLIRLHVLLSQMAHPAKTSGNQNGEVRSAPAPMTLPAQAAGGVL